jgi:DNA-binding transcriptional regulator YdaS (Cro superfamily)
MNRAEFKRLIEHFGSQAKLAKEMGVSRSAISHWITRESIPATHAIQIEIITVGEFRAVDLV